MTLRVVDAGVSMECEGEWCDEQLTAPSTFLVQGEAARLGWKDPHKEFGHLCPGDAEEEEAWYPGEEW